MNIISLVNNQIDLKKASNEESKLKPWTLLAKSKAKAEEELAKIEGYSMILP